MEKKNFVFALHFVGYTCNHEALTTKERDYIMITCQCNEHPYIPL